MTVSRVLNHPESVSPETRNRVLEVIARLGYRPNAIARSLKLQRTHTIGLITGGLDNWFYVQMSLGAVRELRNTTTASCLAPLIVIPTASRISCTCWPRTA